MNISSTDLASEFYMNLPPAAARLRASRIAVQGGFTGGPPPGAHRGALSLPYPALYCNVL